MFKVIALDPGVTTGWAEGIIEDGYMRVRCGQEEFRHLELYDWLLLKHMDYLICESFEFRKGKSQQGVNLYPCEMIGVVILFTQKREAADNLVYLYMQPPATQGDKAFWTDEKLKEANVYRVGKEHGISAMKHLLYWYQFGSGYQYNKKGFGPWQE